MPTRLETRLRALEAQCYPAPLAGVGLAALLAYVALHPSEPWELPTLTDLTTPPTGLAQCLLEARHRQDTAR